VRGRKARCCTASRTSRTLRCGWLSRPTEITRGWWGQTSNNNDVCNSKRAHTLTSPQLKHLESRSGPAEKLSYLRPRKTHECASVWIGGNAALRACFVVAACACADVRDQHDMTLVQLTTRKKKRTRRKKRDWSEHPATRTLCSAFLQVTSVCECLFKKSWPSTTNTARAASGAGRRDTLVMMRARFDLQRDTYVRENVTTDARHSCKRTLTRTHTHLTGVPSLPGFVANELDSQHFACRLGPRDGGTDLGHRAVDS
jgi:hypothetical protein